MASDIKNDLHMLYERYFDDVYRYLLYFTNNQNETEDLTQETFVKVYKHYHHYQNRASIKTWIFSIAKNVAIDHYRKKKVLSVLPGKMSHLKSTSYSPDKMMEEKANWESVQAALLELNTAYRNVVILRGLQELTVSETAEILGWTENKVRINYHRAIKKLREKAVFNEEGWMDIYESHTRGSLLK